MKTGRLYSLALFMLLMICSSLLFSQNSVLKEVDVQLCGKSSGEITRSEISENAIITCVPSDYIVKSFDFSISRKGDLIAYTGTGNKLTEQMLSIIMISEQGEKFIIENIIAEKPGVSKRKLAAVIFSIK
jgi:hypothetical protein